MSPNGSLVCVTSTADGKGYLALPLNRAHGRQLAIVLTSLTVAGMITAYPMSGERGAFQLATVLRIRLISEVSVRDLQKDMPAFIKKALTIFLSDLLREELAAT